MRKERLLQIPAFLAAALWAVPASAASTPRAIQVTVICGLHGVSGDPNDTPVDEHGKPVDANDVGQCPKDVKGWFDGRVEWYSNGTLVYVENGPFYGIASADHSSSIELMLDGNNDPAQFEAIYDNPKTSILTAPNLEMKVYYDDEYHPNGKDQDPPKNILLTDQKFKPVAAALWSKHTEDTVQLEADIAAGDAATLAAAKAYSDAGDKATLAQANAHADQGDQMTLMEANHYADQGDTNTEMAICGPNGCVAQQMAAEAAARQAGDQNAIATSEAYADANFVHRTGNINETVTGVKTFTDVIQATGGVNATTVTANQFCFGGDCRDSWNNQNATSVAPWVRSCPATQILVSTGPYSWACQAQAALPGFICGNALAAGGATCGGAQDMGVIAFGGAKTSTGALPAGGSADAWYSVTFNNSGNSYHPHVYLSAGSVEYQIDVYTDCNGSALGCGVETGQTSTSKTNWETNETGGDYSSPQNVWTTPSPGQAALVRVRPLTINPTCSSYTVVFQNG